MTSVARSTALLALLVTLALAPVPGLAEEPPDGPTAQQLLQDWMAILRSLMRVLLYATSALGIVLAAVSLFRAYDTAEGDRGRVRHLSAALFAGVITITGVVIGWISGLLIPT